MWQPQMAALSRRFKVVRYVPAIRVPCLVVAGELDQATRPAQARELHQSLVRSEHVVLDGASHLSNIERPDDGFGAVVVDLLTRFSEEYQPHAAA